MSNGVIFDLDGTLWDVTDSTYESVNKVAKKYKLKEISKETICKSFGSNREESAKLYFPYLDLNDSVKLIDEISKTNIDNLKNTGGRLYSRLKEVLSILSKEYDLYIVSNTSENEYINAFLTTSETKEYFKSYIAASSLKISKAQAIKKVIEDNNLENAVYVGDTVRDYEAANENDIPFIQSRYGFGENLNLENGINEPYELIKIIKQIFYS